MTRTKKIISWTLRILVSLGFVLASSGKLTSNPAVIEMFENWGYPNKFYLLIGVFELLLAILLVIPKTLKIAIVGLLLVMTGATITHVVHDPFLQIIRPLIFSAMLIAIYFLNFKSTD